MAEMIEFPAQEPMIEPICNIQVEQALLGKLLADNSVWYLLDGLEANHFQEPVHQRIFVVICEELAAGRAVDPLVIKSRFDRDAALEDLGGGKYLQKLALNSIHVINPADYAEEITELYKRRKLVGACMSAVNEVLVATDHLALESIKEALFADLDDCTSRQRVVTERELWERLYNRLNTEYKIYSTGFSRLDTAMDGGIHQGMMYGFVARKKTGKTMLATTLSDNLMNTGVRHLYLALEMGSERIHQRSAARALKIKESAFKMDYGKSNSCLTRVADATVASISTRLWCDVPGISIDGLREEVVKAKRLHGITGFIVDSWQLVRGQERNQSKASHLDNVAQVLAELCAKHNLWCIVTAQENQDGNVRDGEGLRLACDQVYRLCKRNEESTQVWMDMMETRYTPWVNIGTDINPAFELINGTHFEQI